MPSLLAAVDALLPREFAGADLCSYTGAVLVPRLGVVIDVEITSKTTGQATRGEVIAVPASELAAPAAPLRAFAAAIDTLADMDGDTIDDLDVADLLRLDVPRYDDDSFAPSAEDEARRAAARGAIDARFPAVAARLREVYGLRLPRHVGVLAAFFRGLSPTEARGLRGEISSMGVLDWFADGGLDRRPPDGADLRLHGRFRRDPPEMVSLLHGGGDGLHFGLWYDDPAELPSFVVESYARDDGVVRTRGCTTALQHLMARREEHAEDAEGPPTALDRALDAALEAACEADEEAVAADGPRSWADCQRLPSVSGVGPALPGGIVDAIWPSYEHDTKRAARYELRALRVHRWVREARAALAAGRPGPALLVGRELLWLDDGDDAVALELLGGAYRALGRDALAEVARVHLGGRNRASVDIYRP